MWGNSAAYQRGPCRYAGQLFTARPSVIRGEGWGGGLALLNVRYSHYCLPTVSQASTATVFTSLVKPVALTVAGSNVQPTNIETSY